ncbi:MAG: hypothetical protein KAR83_10335 [Thermodesulfovibrionales bacterium]|nr:hypothetical protein [Thermodesulfovibrionales bacterium]
MSRTFQIVITLAICAISALSVSARAETGQLQTLQGKRAAVLYPPGLESDARDVLAVFSDAYDEVRAELGFTLDYRPAIVIISDRKAFSDATGSRHISAYAVADKGLIVMDYSRVLTKPFTLKGTLKHELVHLVLGRHPGKAMPKWLNEGVAQLVAESPAEIVLSRSTSVLSGAVLSGRLIPLTDLKNGFPAARRGMVLAYEESLSFVSFLEKEYGRDALISILKGISSGSSASEAISDVTGLSMIELENKWKLKLKAKASWIMYFSNHFYELLFMLAALVTVYGFMRVIIRIRTYRDEDDDEE